VTRDENGQRALPIVPMHQRVATDPIVVGYRSGVLAHSRPLRNTRGAGHHRRRSAKPLPLLGAEGRAGALRYGVGVGGEGFGWSGVASVHTKQEWPDWYPPKEMLQRKPDLRPAMTELQSGLGMVGGPANPLGARALYLWQGKKDTLYRIHGSNEPWTIGQNVSSGCIRMTNEDIVDLYERTPVGTKVVVLPSPTAQSLLDLAERKS
jgi:lipoprotein-anchoring transpeptidase ErfK/SrfK